MSETEHIIGKLTPIFSGLELEVAAKLILKIIGNRRNESEYKSYLDQVKGNNDDLFYVGKHSIYLIERSDVNAAGDIAKSKKENNGSISFELRYYNGGSNFIEMLESALEKLD